MGVFTAQSTFVFKINELETTLVSVKVIIRSVYVLPNSHVSLLSGASPNKGRGSGDGGVK